MNGILQTIPSFTINKKEFFFVVGQTDSDLDEQ